MGIFDPDFIFSKTVNITPEFVKSLGVTSLILDVDNTLATHGNPVPAPGIEKWVEDMQAAGISLVIASNNYRSRVEPFANLLGLKFVSFSAKPSSLGFKKAMDILNSTPQTTAVVGDQILTDILGAHLMGMKGIMVLAILEEKGIGFKLKRAFEKGYIDRYKQKHGGFM